MNGWRWGFLLLVYAALILKTGAVEHGRTQPTERISGGISFIFISFDSFFLNSVLVSSVNLFDSGLNLES